MAKQSTLDTPLPRRLLLVGGTQRFWDHFRTPDSALGKALILEVDTRRNVARRCVEHETPDEARPEDRKSAITFKAGSLDDSSLFVPTQTEILEYRLPGLERASYLSLPIFNDVHHVAPMPDGTLLVAATGLDMVAHISRNGEIIEVWNVLGEDPWERFSPNVDYRKVLSTKPHRSHPNFVFRLGSQIWTTRFEQRDAVCLNHGNRRIEIGVERPHDGIVHDGLVYFTTVNGWVIAASASTFEPAHSWNLNDFGGGRKALGWCRGLYVIDRDHVLVAFSRLRPSALRQNLRWVREQFGHDKSRRNLPTRIVLYQLSAGRSLWRFDTEPHGLNVIFSIHASRPA